MHTQHTHAHTYIYTLVYTFMCTLTYTHVQTYTYMTAHHTHMYTHTCTHTHMYTHTHAHTYMYTHTHVHTHVHTHTLTDRLCTTRMLKLRSTVEFPWLQCVWATMEPLVSHAHVARLTSCDHHCFSPRFNPQGDKLVGCGIIPGI